MSRAAAVPSLLPYRLLLHLVSLALPRRQRAAWAADWTSELWYVRQALVTEDLPRPSLHHRLLTFTAGAFADATALRHLDPSAAPHRHTAAPSPIRCLVTLLCLLVASALASQLLPRVHRVLDAALHPADPAVVTISPADVPDASIPLSTLRSWQHRSQHLFAGFAFVAPQPLTVRFTPSRTFPSQAFPSQAGLSQTRTLTVAVASDNLLRVLGATALHPVPPATPTTLPGPTANLLPDARPDPLPRVLLSQSTWTHLFASRPELLGSLVVLDGTTPLGKQPARIAGILPDQLFPSATPVDLWLLLPDALATRLPETTPVTVLARLAPAAAPTLFPKSRWTLSVPSPDGESTFLCTALSARRPAVLRTWLFTLLLALLCLPATNFSSAAEHNRLSVRLPPPVARRRSFFVAGKLLLLLPAVGLAALDLAFALPSLSPDTPVYLQLLFSFTGSLTALHWIFRDQSQRCPVCLGKLRCPVRVGQPSRNFLSWNGTELICTSGHGFLHVPEIPTSWFNHPRWLHLNPSWSSLFLQAT